MSDTITLYKTYSFEINADPDAEPIDAVAWEQVGEFHTQRRSVMGQDEDGTPNGQDYIESRLVSGWVKE